MIIKENKLNIIIFTILASILIFIYKPVIEEAILYNSLDFQWSPSKLVAEGINHYQYMLDGKRDDIIGSQFGEYLHGTYILFYPFTFFSWEHAKIIWLIINLLLLITIPLIICKRFSIGSIETILIIFFFAACNVAKVNIIIGQYSLFILFFLCLPFIKNSIFFTILSGISYFKYSIGYVLFFNYIASKKIKFLIYSLFPFLLGIFIYAYQTKSNIFLTFFEPFELAVQNQLTNHDGISIMPKNFFLFSIFEFLNFRNKSVIILLVSLFINFLFILKISKIKDNLLKLSCLCISSLIFFPHYPHDYILILPILIFSIKNFENFISKINFFFSVYFLNFFRVFEIYIPKFFEINNNFFEFMISYVNILFLLLLLLINIYRDKINKTFVKLKWIN